MAVALDQTATTLAGGTPGTLTLSWATLPTAGSSAFVQVGLAGAGTITSVIDNGTSPVTFTRDAIDTPNGVVSLYRGNNITLPSSGSYHVTIVTTGGGAVDYHAGGATFTGLAGGSPTSTINTSTATSTAVTTGNLTPAHIGDLLIGSFADAGGTQTITLTTSGANSVFSQTNGNTAFVGAMAYHVVTTTTAQPTAWTISLSSSWAAVGALYAATTGTTATAGLAAGTGAALQPAGHNASLAAGTGTAPQPVVFIQPGAALASGTGAAKQPGVLVGTIVTPTAATGTGFAQSPTPLVTFTAGLAHGTGTASQRPANAGLASGTGTGQQPKALVTFTGGLAHGTGTAQTVTPKLIRNPLNLGALLTEQVPDGSLALTNLFGALLTEHSPDATLALLDFDAVLTGWTMQGPTPLTLSEFNDVTINIAVTNNGSPYNLTGVTLNLLLKTKAGTPDANALTFSSAGGSPAITVTNAVGGLANAVIPNTDLEAETYNFYRLDVVASGLTNTTLYGPITWITL